MTENLEFEVNVRKDLCRLSRFGANISDSHSCFIFVPPSCLEIGSNRDDDRESLVLGGFHSLSNDILESGRIVLGVGIIGWVAKHRQSIHVSPFEHDSRTLGIYKSDQKLKSFIGIPIRLSPLDKNRCELTGVIACDSKKSYAFSKLQGKLLEDLAIEISNTLRLSMLQIRRNDRDTSWQQFLARGEALVAALGPQAVEVLRARPVNFSELEANLSTGDCLELSDQIFRLIQQALPPHFPSYRLPNGDVILILDNMMASFYENKICALTNHVLRKNQKLQFKFTRKSWENKQGRLVLDKLISSTNPLPATFQLTQPISFEARYEYRRA